MHRNYSQVLVIWIHVAPSLSADLALAYSHTHIINVLFPHAETIVGPLLSYICLRLPSQLVYGDIESQ